MQPATTDPIARRARPRVLACASPVSLQIGQSNPQTRVWALELPERPSAPRPGYADVADRCGISPLYVRTASGKTFYNYCRGSPVVMSDPNGMETIFEQASRFAEQIEVQQRVKAGEIPGPTQEPTLDVPDEPNDASRVASTESVAPSEQPELTLKTERRAGRGEQYPDPKYRHASLGQFADPAPPEDYDVRGATGEIVGVVAGPGLPSPAFDPAETERAIEQTWQLVEKYDERGLEAARAASEAGIEGRDADPFYLAWNLAREDYRTQNLEGGDRILRNAEHYLFRRWLQQEYPTPVLIPRGLPVDIPPEYNPTIPMWAPIMALGHDPVYNPLRETIGQKLFNITPTTPEMYYFEMRGYSDVNRIQKRERSR